MGVNAIHDFVWTLLTTSERRLKEERFTCPLQVFLAGSTLSPQNVEYQESHDMVGIMSALKYIIKAIVFWHVKMDDETINRFEL